MSTRKKDPHTFKMMLVTLVAVCGLVAVILFAFRIVNKGRAGRVEMASTEEEIAGIASADEGQGEDSDFSTQAGGYFKESETDGEDQDDGKVYLIKGDPTSSNSYERITRLSYTKTVRYLQKDIDALDADGLMITRAEILGRHGRIFNDQNLQDYFERQSWYNAQYTAQEFDENCLNEVERYNMEFLHAAEQTLQK